MEVTVSKILLAVVAVIVSARNVHAGYIYPRPNIAFELPKNIPNFQEELRQKAIKENLIHKTHESVISYSVPFEDLRYLHQFKTEHRPTVNFGTVVQSTHTASGPNVALSTLNNIPPVASVVNIPAENLQHVNIPVNEPTIHNVPAARPTVNLPASVEHHSSSVVDLLHHSNIAEVNIPTVKIPSAINQESRLHVNSELSYTRTSNIPNLNIKSTDIPESLVRHSDFVGNAFSQVTIPTNNIPAVNLRSVKQGNLEINAVQHTNVPTLIIPSVDLPVSIHQQSDLEFTTQHHLINHEVNSELNGLINVRNSVPPQITKHIYFHVPPPEIEEPAVVHTIAPKKKIYKIIFIKAPSQSMKNNAQLQINAQNSIAPIEEKTIIYVLSKKPEPQNLFVPNPVPSEHEVLFVKYSGNPDISTEQVNDTIEQPASELLPTSRLLPGLVNGKR